MKSNNHQSAVPEHTAVRVALWRALHVQIDSKPHVLVDEIGMKLIGEDHWRDRQDMHPQFSKSMRASIVARARFIEDLVEEQVKEGITQFVILGAGLDTFAQRRTTMASQLHIFEVDQPGPQAWKQKRLVELGFALPQWLHFVPVNFEVGESWWDRLIAAGFDQAKPAIFVSTGVSMYLSKEANLVTLRQMARLAKDSIFAMTFMLTPDLMAPEERSSMEFVMKKAEEAGTPFKSLFTPPEILMLAENAGFTKAQYISFEDLALQYFSDRSDGLRPPSAEGFLVVTT